MMKKEASNRAGRGRFERWEAVCGVELSSGRALPRYLSSSLSVSIVSLLTSGLMCTYGRRSCSAGAEGLFYSTFLLSFFLPPLP